jgi:hypothetical protein
MTRERHLLGHLIFQTNEGDVAVASKQKRFNGSTFLSSDSTMQFYFMHFLESSFNILLLYFVFCIFSWPWSTHIKHCITSNLKYSFSESFFSSFKTAVTPIPCYLCTFLLLDLIDVCPLLTNQYIQVGLQIQYMFYNF